MEYNRDRNVVARYSGIMTRVLRSKTENLTGFQNKTGKSYDSSTVTRERKLVAIGKKIHPTVV